MDFRFFGDLGEDAGVTPVGGEGYRNVWVVAEVAAGALTSGDLAALGQARELADQIGAYACAVLLGDGVDRLSQDAIAYGADQVLVASDLLLAEYQPELFARILAELVQERRPEILLLAASTWGNDLAPRLAQRLDTGLISHCTQLDLDMSERQLLGTFPVLGGEMYHTDACPEARPQMATLEPGAFGIPGRDAYRRGTVEQVQVELASTQPQLTWHCLDCSVSLPPTPLSKARIVVSVGRGMRDHEGLALVQRLAVTLGGVVAGSRGAFDQGWISEEQIVGVGGQTIAPDLYVACGLSGDIHHYYGVQDSKFVVAINPDARAPIMKVAHMAIVSDARRLIPAILEILETRSA